MKFDFSKLTIEHILPQTWQSHWPLMDGVASYERDIALHGVGNLTLVSHKLNPSLSNAPWLPTAASKNSKRSALEQHSRLEMNARLVRDHPERWDEACMKRRAAELFETARDVWPVPGSI